VQGVAQNRPKILLLVELMLNSFTIGMCSRRREHRLPTPDDRVILCPRDANLSLRSATNARMNSCSSCVMGYTKPPLWRAKTDGEKMNQALTHSMPHYGYPRKNAPDWTQIWPIQTVERFFHSFPARISGKTESIIWRIFRPAKAALKVVHFLNLPTANLR
jgi:hypothetical protein